MSSIMKGIVDETELDENLHKWFKEKWVRFGPDGKIRGACARGDDSEGKPKCLPQKKAQNLGKKGRKYAASKKRREDPNPERTGKAKNVATKKKTNEDIPFNECPQCRGPIVHESMMNEKQDACYHKVKSRYKVWPSAYASGALVQCRKKGASNWGTGGKKKNESSIMKGIVDEARAKQYVKPYNDPQTGEQIGWVSSDGYHKKYWQKFAKASAIKHAKLDPNEVQEDYTGEFAAEKTPAINPYGGLKDNQFRGAISEEPTDNPTGASGEGGWRKYKPKPAGQIKEDEKLDAMFEPTIDKLHNLVDYEIKNAGIMLTDDPYEDISKILLGLGLSKEEASDYELIDAILDKMEDNGTYDELWEDTAYAGGMGQGGNAGESYRKFTPKSAGTFNEDELDEACWKGYHKEGNKKMFGKTYPNCVKNTNEEEQLDEKCWDSHKQVGMKNKGGRQVPNCVPKESAIMKGLKR